MNTTACDPLSAYDLADITAKVTAMIQGGVLGEAVSVLVQTGSAMDPASGVVTVAGSADSVTGYLGPVGLDQIPDGSPVQVGDSMLIVLSTDLTREPVTGSTFVADGTTYRVVHCEQDTLDVAWHLFGRRTT